MPLIVSSSGIRGTVEGRAGENLTPLDVVSWVGAWGIWIRRHHRGSVSLVVGQDARPSGALFRPLAIHTLRALGYEIHDIGLTTTPTLAMVIPHLAAQGGLILTASHNPSGWNALKFLDAAGEFLPPTAIEEIDALRKELEFSSTDHPGSVHLYEGALTYHLSTLVSHPWVCTHRIRQAQLRIVVDTINSSGGVFVPALLESLGVSEIRVLNGEPNGRFAHPPEPLPENLQDLAREVQASRAHVGIAVDPDVDRVAFYLPDGSPFGEEYTLVAVTDYILSHEKGPVVANQSTTAAVAWIANRYGVPFYESRVGEYYVVQKMKAVGAVIGGEGNGGIIWPRLHYGRDALVGIALFLSHLAEAGGDPVALRARYPRYVLLKAKMSLSSPPPSDFWRRLADVAADAEISLEDGLKLRWAEKWIHLRASATEPLLRLIAE
ncbi:MAG: phosphoglucosamine mutase, partial [Bacteroidia bacterium]|nr:phosphoglucosamine mutase [Bacteroidia bacterium]